MCPGLDYDRLWRVLDRSVELFGRNRVFSNVIIGLGETDAEMEACINRLTSHGVIPVLRPLNPVAGFTGTPRPSAERLKTFMPCIPGRLLPQDSTPQVPGPCARTAQGAISCPGGTNERRGSDCRSDLCRHRPAVYRPGIPGHGTGRTHEAEMVINEKTALEYALGDSLSGKRAAVIIKNVGVNACADPLLQATAQGLIGGVVLVAGDDPDAQGSQTAQDSRYYGELAELPVIEPDETTCYSGVEAALQASEQFSRVAMLRLTPPILDADASGTVVTPERPGRAGYPSGPGP